MESSTRTPLIAGLVAIPETAGSALYGMIDVLSAAGTLWNELVGQAPGEMLFKPVIVSPVPNHFAAAMAFRLAPTHRCMTARIATSSSYPRYGLRPTMRWKGGTRQ